MDAITLATTIEEMNENRFKKVYSRWRQGDLSPNNYQNSSSSGTKNFTPRSQYDKEKHKEKQWFGKEVKPPDTSRKTTNPYNKPNLEKCFRCGLDRHLSNECPKRKTLTILDEEAQDLEERDNSEEDTTYVEPDEGDQLSCV